MIWRGCYLFTFLMFWVVLDVSWVACGCLLELWISLVLHCLLLRVWGLLIC